MEGEKIKVFLVDDEAIILQGLEKTYSWDKMGAQVTGTSRNPNEAVEAILELDPDIVITDVRMKQMTGLELIRTVKERSKKKYIWIVISAYRDFEYAQRACELGAFSYLLKPIEDEKLERVIRQASSQIRQEREKQKRLLEYEYFIETNRKEFEDYMVGKTDREQMEEKELYATLERMRSHAGTYINQAMDYIQEHLDDEFLSVSMTAQELHLNPVYFGRLFRQGMERSFTQYLLEERIRLAKKLLKTTDNTISQIAEKVGIPNPSYFTQQFKKSVGQIPTEYRKKYNEK